MDSKLLDKLVRLPTLHRANKQTAPCKVCGSQARFFDVVDFNKSCNPEDVYPFGASGVTVEYFRCSACQFLFTRFFDDWTPQDFARFVYNDDYIKVDGSYAGFRAEISAAEMAQRLAGLTDLRILDYGSGSGLFAVHLRSHGFKHVSSYDPFSSPSLPTGKFDIVICIEVLEHSPAPQTTLSDIASLLGPGGCVIFTTGIQPPEIGAIRANWWYVAPRNGHVSIYSLNALAHLGQSAGLVLYAGSDVCAFAGGLSPASRQILSSVGRPLMFFRLTAPRMGDVLPAEQQKSWHGVEGVGSAPFRWTRDAEILWRVQAPPFQPCELHVAIPIQNEVRSGFAENCCLEVGNQRVPLAGDSDVMTASLSIKEAADSVIKLVMPPLLRPCDLRATSDSRRLGLAISTKTDGRIPAA